jgi:hypothetical protein
MSAGDDVGSSSLEGRATALVGGWTVVWDPMMFVPDDMDDFAGMFEEGIWTDGVDRALSRLSKGGRVYSFVAEGSSDTHGFAWYVDGKRRRLWLSQEGHVAMQDGTPLPEELASSSEEPDPEQRLFVLMEKLTGLSIGTADAATYRLFA